MPLASARPELLRTAAAGVPRGWIYGEGEARSAMTRSGASSIRDRLRCVVRQRLPIGSCRSRLAAVIVVCALAVPVAVIGGVAPASAGITAQGVPGGVTLLGVACPSASTCQAVGGNNSGQEVVVPIINGTPGSAQPVPGTTLLAGVACASATTCVAVGDNSPSSQGVVVPIINGTPGTAQPGGDR